MGRVSFAVRAFSILAAFILSVAPLHSGAQPLVKSPQSSKEVALAELPKEARETLELIKRGGPFPYRQDGTVFGNREQLLPTRERAYYREYTVRMPGAKDRGGRRIVTGGNDVKRSGEYWYTEDHYNSFRRIKE